MNRLLLMIFFFTIHISAKTQNNDSINKVEIIKLQKEIQSLKDTLWKNKLQFENQSKLEIVTKVNDFYDSSWNKLVLLLGILAIAVPLIIQWMQQRNFKNSENRIFTELNSRFDDKLSILQKENQNEITKLNEVFDKKIEELSESNNQELIALNTIFNDTTKNIKEEYLSITDHLTSNLHATIAILFESKEAYDFCAAMYISSCHYKIKHNNLDPVVPTLDNFLHNLEKLQDIKSINNYIQQNTDFESLHEILADFNNYELNENIKKIMETINEELARFKEQ